MSIYARLAILLTIVLAIAAAWWKLQVALDNADARGYLRHQQEARDIAEQQAQRIRDLQRAAELRYTVKAETRDRFITQTITEVRHAAQSLAVCPVPEPLRVRLNAAAQCARDDSPPACSPD